jgi:hypothetical protein
VSAPVDLDIYAFQYGDDGIVLNSDSISLPFVDITQVSGLDSAPMRSSTQDHEGIDGGYVDAEFETIRTIVLGGTAYADQDMLEPYLDQLKTNFAPSTSASPLYVRTASTGLRALFCKCTTGLVYDWDQARRLSKADIQITLMAEDPAFYEAQDQVLIKNILPAVITGKGYPKFFPYGYGGQPTSSGLIVYNEGNRDSYGTLQVSGPINSNFSITNDADVGPDGISRFIRYNQALSSTDSVVFDLRKKSVVLNGNTNRRIAMTADSDWWKFKPGPNNIRFLGVSAGNPLLTITMRSAWR